MHDDNDNHILMGADAIAKFLGITRRQAYRLIYECSLPTFKLGGTVAARKPAVMAWLDDKERVAA